MKKIFAGMTAILLILVLVTGCAPATQEPAAQTPVVVPTLNGIQISQYTIVYSENAPDYCLRAAQYIRDRIGQITGVTLTVATAESGSFAHEIVVGQTLRPISAALEAQTQNVEFAILADDNHIALEGDYFIIAAAAYYFVETYITGKMFESVIPKEITIHTPITREAKNVIFLIGDGMGENQTKLFDYMEISDEVTYHDNEAVFYGYYLPYQGYLRTNSLSGTTDSAAAATALACGYKTYNSYVGKDANLQDVQSLTELANAKGMATAIMSTDKMNGATPAGFTAHVEDRDDTTALLESQAAVKEQGTTILCGLNSKKAFQEEITRMLTNLEASEEGFFLMYEEGYIDKAGHNLDLEGMFQHMVRFNQAIGVCMEYVFYHPDTFLIITADHETGGLTFQDGTPVLTVDGHTAVNVPIFGYGQGAEAFDSCEMENNLVPMVIAGLWGETQFGDQAA